VTGLSSDPESETNAFKKAVGTLVGFGDVKNDFQDDVLEFESAQAQYVQSRGG
jgi:hypothetical protein